jgi:hypothetical protein
MFPPRRVPVSDDVQACLVPTLFINSDHPAVRKFALDAAGDAATEKDKAVRLFYAVRDGIRYDPYRIVLSVEGMRALMYYASYCVDREHGMASEANRDKYRGLLEVLTPICKAYCSDVAFRATEMAIQTYGGYGYCAEYPVEQFMRDIKIASIYEGANGIQALDLVGRKLGLKKGMYFMSLLGEMNATVATCQRNVALKDLAENVQQAVNTLTEMAMYFAGSAKAGKFLVPVGNAYPFLMMMGKVVTAWLLLWEAGVAREKLEGIAAGKGIDPADAGKLSALAKEDADAAFYIGKIAAARYFIKHVLPEVGAAVAAIKSEDLSMVDIPEESF